MTALQNIGSEVSSLFVFTERPSLTPQHGGVIQILHLVFPKSVQLKRKECKCEEFFYKRGLGVKLAHLKRNLA